MTDTDFEVTDETTAEELMTHAQRVSAAEALISIARLDERQRSQSASLVRIEHAINKLDSKMETLTQHVNHQQEISEKRLSSLEDTRDENLKEEGQKRAISIRQEIAFDARKLALIGGFFVVITTVIQVVLK